MQSRDKQYKKSGVLLPLSSLPSSYGIGSLGVDAYRFIDFLKETNQSCWQMLPLVPLGEGNSPYKSTSLFAGEILYIDLDFLVRDGLLSQNDLPKLTFKDNTDYDFVRKVKLPLIKKAAENFDTDNKDYLFFLQDNRYWLDDFALFSAISKVYDIDSLEDFPEGLKYRIPNDIKEFTAEHGALTDFYKISQYLFFAQFNDLKRYASKQGISLIGDIPFYVSLFSADVWAKPDNFLLDRNYKPSLVAGVPPDMFSETGQLWGNPIYDLPYLKSTGYDYWLKRLEHYFCMFDIIRIDHFRAFAE